MKTLKLIKRLIKLFKLIIGAIPWALKKLLLLIVTNAVTGAILGTFCAFDLYTLIKPRSNFQLWFTSASLLIKIGLLLFAATIEQKMKKKMFKAIKEHNSMVDMLQGTNVSRIAREFFGDKEN